VTSKPSDETTGYLGAIIAVTAWGANAVILKFLTGVMSVTLLNASRIAVASAIFLLIIGVLRRNQGFPKLEFKTWLGIAAIGLIGSSLYQLLFANGIRLSSASLTALTSSTNPIWVGILGAFLGQRLTRWQWIGIPITMIGVAFLSYSSIQNATVQPLGVALLIASNIGWAVYTVGSRAFMTKLPPLEFTAFSFVLGGLPFVLLTLPSWFAPEVAQIPSSAWLWVVLSALIAQVIGFIAWFTATSTIGASRTSVFLNITPLVGVALAATFLGERITLEKVLAGAVILLGVWLANRK
jgi:drug/metabolite transporter (DMT)-like permease